MPKCRVQTDRDLYTLQIQGRDIYWILHTLEEVAVKSQHYPEIAQAVLLAEHVRLAADRGGWAKGRPISEPAYGALTEGQVEWGELQR